MDVNTKIDSIDQQELKNYLKKAFRQYVLDYGQTLREDELSNLVIRGYYKLTEDYPSWTIGSFKYALAMALNDEESKFNKLTVKNLFIWFKKAKEALMKKDAELEMDRCASNLEAMDGNRDILMDLKLASAIQWKLANFGIGKKYHKDDWHHFPLKYVADCLEQGKKPDEDMI